MTDLPDRPALSQLRIRAKELKRALEAGEPQALERVLASHPKFSGRPPERIQGRRFTLRDAQVTIARELGFDSWKGLVTQLEGARRWESSASFGISTRAFAEARALRHRFCTDLHFLLALLKPPVRTASSHVLAELGLTYERVRDRLAEVDRPSGKEGGTSSTPTYQLMLGWAQGIAIGMGETQVSDQHVLLAFAYGDYAVRRRWPRSTSTLTTSSRGSELVASRHHRSSHPRLRLRAVRWVRGCTSRRRTGPRSRRN
jgi:hypothetical protein